MNTETRNRWERINALLGALDTFVILTERVARGATLLPIPAPDCDPIARTAEQRLCSNFDCFPAAPADFLSSTKH